MPSRSYPEINPQEIEAAHAIAALVDEATRMEAALRQHVAPLPGSQFDRDRQILPRLPPHERVYNQLSTALGCLMGLGPLMSIREREERIEILAGPHGGYALIRNALDCGALAMWLMEAPSREERLRRELHAQLDEISNVRKYKNEMGEATGFLDQRLRNLDQFAVQIGATDWHPKGRPKRPGAPKRRTDELKSTTGILSEIERLNVSRTSTDRSWLATWQLCSGFAHGKLWAMAEAHELTEQLGTRTPHGATFFTTISFQNFQTALSSAMDMCREAVQLFAALGGRDSITLQESSDRLA